MALKLSFQSYQLQLKDTFAVSRESFDTKNTLIVNIQLDQHIGYGEACEHPYYGITIDKMVEELKHLQPFFDEHNFVSPSVTYQVIQQHFTLSNFTLCAIDNALHDLYGKINQQPCYQLWGWPLKRIQTNFTIGIDTIEKMLQKIKDNPYPLYKIKLGTAHDIEIIKTLRKATSAMFRIDANCAWNVEQTIAFTEATQHMNIEFIEQPMKANDWAGMKEVYKYSKHPLIADESCIVHDDVKKCHQHFHGINIKLMKCGGITIAKKMIAEANKLGMKAMVGCMTESTVGISAIGQLTPKLDYVDMDGALLLKNDIANGASINSDGYVTLPIQNGLGISLKTGHKKSQAT